MAIRGVRGATTVEYNDADEIITATQDLLLTMVSANGICLQDIAYVLFTVTPDLDATFPARAARLLGWRDVPLMDACEIPVPGSLPRCIRVLLVWNTEKPQNEIAHVYLHKAKMLRPDWVKEQGE